MLGHTNVSSINLITNVEKEFPLFFYGFFPQGSDLPTFTTTSKILKNFCVTFTSSSPPRSCSSSAFTANWKCSISKATSGVKGLASDRDQKIEAQRSQTHLASPVHCFLVSISLAKAADELWKTNQRFGLCQDNQHILEMKKS